MRRHQHSFTHTESNAISQPAPRRDRYRAPPHYDDLVDIQEEPCAPEDELDSFDEQLLQLPYPDRQRQAELGQTRLSFPPKPSRHCASGSYSQQPRPLHGGKQCLDGDGNFELYQGPRVSLSQYAYTPGQIYPSSDPLLGTSSPAYKAGQRRAETHHISVPRPSRRLPSHTVRSQSDPERRLRAQEDTTLRPVTPLNPTQAPPVVQGIQLVAVSELPDRIRPLFPFPTFNAIQSKCFHRVFRCDDNFVLASPTGSGKTAVLELAICRAFASYAAGQYKIVYQAPIKALCSERQQDWQKKFSHLGLQCIELTGDSDSTNLKHVQTADIIVTTPEKWDSITRKWKDHQRLMRLIKLFLIDEVHMLKEDRGAILEAVVSRMRTIGTDVRFVALSATVPNLEDVAAWLGRSSATPYVPANSERFGEDFRPVKLKKHVRGYSYNGNEFVLDQCLDKKLPEVIAEFSERKPIMVFCMTRASADRTAKVLAHWFSSGPGQKYWSRPPQTIHVSDQDLAACLSSGVAFHHAGLEAGDRLAIEKGFLEGNISVICCTSTLAIGVNLPCHFAIIKNTVAWSTTGAGEYSDLEIMQMIGRAGRPQFDNSAVAVIMTRQSKVRRYENMVSGQEILESKLHHGLIEHLNAEIALGTINDLASARTWLSSTFLYVRLKKNPTYYRLEGAKTGQDVDQQLDNICLRDLALLRDYDLVVGDTRFRCSDLGEAMARYYVDFRTMQVIVGLQPRAQISEILSALSQAAEFRDIRFRSGEKPLYKAFNGASAIRFPIPVNLEIPAHKVSLIIQSVLGGADMPNDKDVKLRRQYHADVALVFKHVQRLIRCIADCQISTGDSVALMNALLIQRSLHSRAWDDGPMHMRQIPSIGVVAVRKLVNAGIRTIEELEISEPHRIEMAIGRNPPFGRKVLEDVKRFPKLRVSVNALPNTITKLDDGVKIQFKVEIGFLNEKPACTWQSQPVYVCLLVETSDGRLAHFARISGQRLGMGQSLVIPATLKSPAQSLNCYVMCDSIAGTMRAAAAKPQIAPSLFPVVPSEQKSTSSKLDRPTSNTSKRRIENAGPVRRPSDDYDDDGLQDEDLFGVPLKDLDFEHIENYANPILETTRRNTAKNAGPGTRKKPALFERQNEDGTGPKQLENGKWACNHNCKDKSACKHMCCRDGLDRPPPPKKTGKKPDISDEQAPQRDSKDNVGLTKLNLTASKRKTSTGLQTLDLTRPEKRLKPDYAKDGPREFRQLDSLHKKVQSKDPPPSISAITHTKPAYSYSAGGEHSLSFMKRGDDQEIENTAASTDYGDYLSDSAPCYGESVERAVEDACDGQHHSTARATREQSPALDTFPDCISDEFGDDDSLLGEVMVGLADSQDIHASSRKEEEYRDPFDASDLDWNDDFSAELEKSAVNDGHPSLSAKANEKDTGQRGEASSSTVKAADLGAAANKSRHFAGLESGRKHSGFASAKTMVKDSVLRELRQPRASDLAGKLTGNSFIAAKTNERTNPVTIEDSVAPSDTDKQGPAEPDPKYKDLEPWLLAEFGGIVELVDE